MTFSGRIVAHVSKITSADERLIACTGEDERPECLVVTQFCHYVNETLFAFHAKRVLHLSNAETDNLMRRVPKAGKPLQRPHMW